MTFTRTLRMFLALVLLLAVAAPGWADRETASFFAQRGDKALSDGDAAGAEEHFRRALEEDESYAPARFGLARALIAAELREDGLRELKDAVTGLGTDPAWKPTLKKARSLLDELDKNGAELRRLVDAHVEELVSFARKWTKKDADTAVRALRAALVLRPGHPKASQMIEALGHSAKGPPRAIFDGVSLTGFAEMGPPRWTCEGGVLVVNVKEGAYIGRTDEMFEGDFDVRMVARVVETYEAPTFFALAPAFDGKDGHYSFGLLNGKYAFQEDVDPDTERVLLDANPPHEFVAEEWHTYEVQFRGSRAIALIDGKQIGVDEERPDARMSGFVGIKCQHCKIEIRSLEVIPR